MRGERPASLGDVNFKQTVHGHDPAAGPHGCRDQPASRRERADLDTAVATGAAAASELRCWAWVVSARQWTTQRPIHVVHRSSVAHPSTRRQASARIGAGGTAEGNTAPLVANAVDVHG
jgi:hypothetical protein